jgi:hypothetical protein
MRRIYGIVCCVALASVLACAESPVTPSTLQEVTTPSFSSGGVAGSGNRLLPSDSTAAMRDGSIQLTGDPIAGEENDAEEGRSGGVAGSGN